MTRGCRKWEMFGIPCAHVGASLNYLGKQLERYVHNYYKVDTYLKIYEQNLSPINGREMWPTTEYAVI